MAKRHVRRNAPKASWPCPKCSRSEARPPHSWHSDSPSHVGALGRVAHPVVGVAANDLGPLGDPDAICAQTGSACSFIACGPRCFAVLRCQVGERGKRAGGRTKRRCGRRFCRTWRWPSKTRLRRTGSCSWRSCRRTTASRGTTRSPSEGWGGGGSCTTIPCRAPFGRDTSLSAR